MPGAAGSPGEPAFAARHADLLIAEEARTHTRLGSRLTYEFSGASSLCRKTSRAVEDMDPALPFAQFIEVDEDWGEPAIWRTIRLYSSPYAS
jgi:putative spermidine/putrescine transport system permease protein